MKASSAVPFLYRSGVRFGDRCLVDGGVSDPLPVRHAYRLGARRLLVIRTVADGEHTRFGWRRRLTLAARAGALPVSMRRMIAVHEHACASANAFMGAPPDEVELVEIRPQAPLRSGLFGSRSESLVADYRTGLADGRASDALARALDATDGGGLTACRPGGHCRDDHRQADHRQADHRRDGNRRGVGAEPVAAVT